MYSTTGNRSDWVFDYMKTVSLHLSSYRVILIIWALGLSLAIPPLVGWNHYSPEPNGLRYTPLMMLDVASYYLKYLGYLRFLMKIINIHF